MTVIPYSTASFLFPGFDTQGELPDVFTHIEIPEVFDYFVAGKRHAEGLMITTASRLWHRDLAGKVESIGGPISMMIIAEKGERDARGDIGVTLGCLWDLRGETADIVEPYKAEAHLREIEKAVARLRTGYEHLAQNAGLSMADGERPLLVDALRAQPATEVEDVDAHRKHMASLREFALEQTRLLLPIEVFKRLGDVDPSPIDRSQLKHGEVAPGGGAQVFVFGAGKKA